MEIIWDAKEEKAFFWFSRIGGRGLYIASTWFGTETTELLEAYENAPSSPAKNS